MPCEHYKDALTEAATTGASPQEDLRTHLAACAVCRAVFEQERSLFASIDTGLHLAANADVPASLLPRVRVRLDVEATPQRNWNQLLVFAAASVALALGVFLFARAQHSGPDDQAKQAPQVPISMPPTTSGHDQNSVSDTQIVSSNANHLQPRVHSTLLHSVASSRPEVLVPPDEREAFSRFVAVLSERREMALALVMPAPQTKDDPASLKPLQINGLEIKPLEGTESEQSGGAERKR